MSFNARELWEMETRKEFYLMMRKPGIDIVGLDQRHQTHFHWVHINLTVAFRDVGNYGASMDSMKGGVGTENSLEDIKVYP